MNQKEKSLWDKAGILLIIVFGIFLFWMIRRYPSWSEAEADDYVLSTMAIQMTGDLQITEEIIAQAKIDFPNFAYRFDESWEGAHNGQTTLYAALNGKIYPWYGGGYSAFCLPFKLLLKLLKINQSYTFVLANFCIYMVVLLYVFLFLKRERKTVFLILLALVCSPTVIYCTWASAEIYIFGFVVLSLVNYLNDSYKRAAVYVSIAGAMNSTVMVLGLVYILDYLQQVFTGVRSFRGFYQTLKENFSRILLFGMCFLPSLTTWLYNLLHMNTLELQAALGFAKTKGWSGRFAAYFFDLNLGYLPFYSLAFLLWMAVFVCAVVKKERKAVALSVAFLGVVAAYSLTLHINCGMKGIARYSAWAAPMFLFALIAYYDRCLKRSALIKTVTVLIAVSSLTTSFVMIWFAGYNDFDSVSYSPLAAWVMDHCPQLYHPYPYTFISRTNHIDGGYWGDEYKQINAYANKEGNVRKILVTKESVPLIKQNLVADEDVKEYIFGKIDSYNYQKKQFYYLDLPSHMNAFFNKDYPKEFNPVADSTLMEKYEGIYWKEGTFHWFSNDATVILQNEDFASSGIEIKYGTSKELAEKYKEDQMNVDIYINSSYAASFNLAQTADMQSLILQPNQFEKPEDGFYRIRFESSYYLQPSKDITGSGDNRQLCFTVSYIGAPQEE